MRPFRAAAGLAPAPRQDRGICPATSRHRRFSQQLWQPDEVAGRGREGEGHMDALAAAHTAHRIELKGDSLRRKASSRVA